MNLKVSDAKREEGFTLIELLVVVIIIGILAAIAIPVFLNQRERAWERTVESDVRNAAIAIETSFTDAFVYPAAFTNDNTTITLATGEEIVPSQLVSLSYAPNAAGDAFEITGCHDRLTGGDPCQTTFVTHATYQSDAGGLQ